MPADAGPVAIMGFGLFCFLVGAHAYWARSAPMLVRRTYLGSMVNVLYAEMPFGLGLILIGAAALISRRPVTDVLALTGLGLAALGCLLVFWHPNWVRP